jgi:hypothetical protein
MKTVWVVILLSLTLALSARGQVPAIQWTLQYGDSGYDDRVHQVLRLSDGTFLVAGERYPEGWSIDDFQLLRVSATGQILNSRLYDFGQMEDLRDATLSPDGTIMLCGSRYDFDTNDAITILMRVNSNLDSLWSTVFDEPDVRNSPSKILRTPDGGYLVTGIQSPPNGYPSTPQLVKFAPTGNPVWAHTYSFEGRENVYFAGTFNAPGGGYLAWGSDFDPVNSISHPLLIRFNSAGDTLWTRVLSTSFDSAEVGLYSNAVIAPDGNIILLLNIYYRATDQSMGGLAKIDFNGNLLWDQLYPADSAWSWFEDITLTNDGGLAVTGGYEPWFTNLTQAYLLKMNSAGVLAWSNSYPNQSSTGEHILAIPDGGLLMTVELDYTSPEGSEGYRSDDDILLYRFAGGDCPPFTPAAPTVVVRSEGNQVRVMWRPVTNPVSGCPVSGYNVFSGNSLSGMTLQATTTDTSAVFPLTNPVDRQFFDVRAVVNTPAPSLRQPAADALQQHAPARPGRAAARAHQFRGQPLR